MTSSSSSSSSVIPHCHSVIPAFFVGTPYFLRNCSRPTSLSIKPKRSFPRSSSWVVHNAKSDGRRRSRDGKHGNGKPWWKRFFFEDDGNWLGLRDEDMELDAGPIEGSEDEEGRGEASEGNKFEAWRRRAEAIVELREARVDALNEEGRMWEDWVMDDQGDGLSWGDDSWEGNGGGFDVDELSDQRGIVERASDFFVGRRREEDDDDMLYEDRVFQYASMNSVSIEDCFLFCLYQFMD